MKSISLKVLVVLISFCFMIGTLYQIYLKVSFPYDTAVVYSSTMDKKASGNGVIFKDEFLLNYNNNSDVVRNLYSNGSRVAARSVVAKAYKAQDDVLKMAQIDILEKEIASLKEAQSPGVLQDINIKSINKQINSSYYDLMTNLKSDNLMHLSDKRENITTLFNKRQIITNQVSNFDDSIDRLVDEKHSLENSISSKPSLITTPKSGYFVDSIDGYENKCSLSAAEDVILSNIDELFNSPLIDSNVVGKVIINPKLLYKVSLPLKIISDVKPATPCKIKFEETGEEISAIFEDAKIELNNEQSLATFSINLMTERLSSIRKSKADIIFKTYEGLKIPKSAVRNNENGQTGVYTVNNVSMKFKLIDILFEDEDYMMCKFHPEDTNTYVREYDTVITKGRDLYDNKAVR